VLFDKIASVYILFKKYLNISALEMASPLCQLYRRTFVPYKSPSKLEYLTHTSEAAMLRPAVAMTLVSFMTRDNGRP